MIEQNIRSLATNPMVRKIIIGLVGVFILICVAGTFYTKSIQVEFDIDAPPSAVWAQLTEFKEHSKWNPYFKNVSGLLHVATHLKIVVHQGGEYLRIEPIILLAKENQELRWLHRDMVPGISDIEHYFIIEPKPDGGSHLILGGNFTGVSYLMGWVSMVADVEPGLLAMGEALKLQAEN